MYRHERRIRVVAYGVVFAALAAIGVQIATAGPSEAGAMTTPRDLLSKLTVSIESKKNFSASLFGDFVDADGDCRGTRVEVLIRDHIGVLDASRCKVQSARWISFPTGQTFSNIDAAVVRTVVTPREAWESGASRWSSSERNRYLNDLRYTETLQVFHSTTDDARGNDDPHDWQPTTAEMRCQYAATWVSVKWRWKMSIDKNEKRALQRMLRDDCGGVKFVPPAQVSGLPNPVVVTTTTTTTTTSTTTTTTPTVPGNPGDSVNCTDFSTWAAAQAWFDRYYPYYGDVANLDSDNDGIACEGNAGAP